ncbi:MAG: hypothetical protein AAF573_13770 [Bacteroidota bacterium]
MTFPTYKILDHLPQENSPNSNPFSVVMEEVGYEIQKLVVCEGNFEITLAVFF